MSTTTTITRMYATYDKAAQVVKDLEAAGIPHSEITILSNSAQHTNLGKYGQESEKQIDRDVLYDTAAGTGAVGAVGGLLAGLGLLVLPGIGPFAAAGWFAATLAGGALGTAAGAAAEGIAELFSSHSGVDRETASRYVAGVQAGGTMVAVRSDVGRLFTIEGIMGTNDTAYDTLGTTNTTTGSSRVA